MQRGFTLIEMLFALILLGILGVLGGSTLLKIYQNYHWQNHNFTQEIQVRNALLQIKRLLENSYLESLILSSGEEIGINPLSLKGKSLMFYEKTQEYVRIGDYALPCLCGIIEPKSIKISNILILEFLSLDSNSNKILNQKCSLYRKANMPQKALFVTHNFIAPKDFYSLKFQGKILEINASKMLLEIPSLFRDSIPLKDSLQIAPKIYFLDSISRLHFGNSITLESKSQLQNIQPIIENITDVKIAKTSLGFALEICIKSVEAIPYCESVLVVEVE
ncbi:prepilin-type N-terminal cleavage/methylation domain-containing protein [uncultured Helicobacter sp.]|uniref:prepilin-type N-terminal cleavage/methylation domain-containing protein n=1 Tax=uncultured Helicobacter sp. TaxID=175537 RepID=UPI002620E816|nr:prepilin-type N-terminal cleavage/methylation domain-containing protein [uncultured Helicobacter sp.]